MSSESSGELDVPNLVSDLRATAGPEMVNSRREYEQQARQLLNERAGTMSRDDAERLLQLFNTSVWAGKLKYSRFSPAFVGYLRQQMLDDLDTFNSYTARLWHEDEQEALDALDELFRDKTLLPGAGRGYPSMLCYLRGNQRFAVCMTAQEKGLAALTDYTPQRRDDGKAAYRKFCERAQQLREDLDLAPEEIDAVLAEAARRYQPETTRQPTQLPTVGPEAFTFLAELGDDSNKQWLDQNKSRWVRELREPFRRMLTEVDERYIVELDPQIDAEVKFGRVLANIRKRWPDEEGEYHEYYWGAFSRENKQNDVQLYVTIHVERLDFGLTFGVASAAALRRLQDRILDHAEEVWRSLIPHVHELVFEDTWSDAEGEQWTEEIEIEDPQGLAEWLKTATSPRIFRSLPSDDALIGSVELVEEIGTLLTALHPLAKLAWGDVPDARVEVEEPDEAEAAGEVYTLEELVEDTYLPADRFEEWTGLLGNPKRRQMLFYGPPGTGKSFVAEHFARYLAGSNGAVEVVQFHPSYTYEDFVEGLRPVSAEGSVQYEVRPGLFQQFCDQARGRDGTYVLVVDEINRTDLSSVLGELMLLLEYRSRVVELPYSQKRFSVPRNVVVLATMNTADRSLALVDFALRRRFNAVAMRPDADVLKAFLHDRGEEPGLVVQLFQLVQDAVDDHDLSPGHSYWMRDDLSATELDRVWRYELRPYLEEHWHEHPQNLLRLDREVAAVLAEQT